MAVTKILARRGGLAQAIAYVVNGDKTEEQVLTATQGCSIKSACAEMQDAKIRWNKTDGVQLYHIIQSFRPGEITPELALEIAQEFVREHLPGYQAVIGIHTDRGTHPRPYRIQFHQPAHRRKISQQRPKLLPADPCHFRPALPRAWIIRHRAGCACQVGQLH